MKFATHLLLFNQDKWLLRSIDLIGNYVDKIYISYSELPWIYNPNARKIYKNSINLDILNNSKFINKIELIKGEWDFEEDQRNCCLNKARKDDNDFLFIIDTDEFYFYNDIENIINSIELNINFDYYTTPWITFWKSFDYVVSQYDGSLINGFPEIAINLRSGSKFVSKRKPLGEKVKQLNYLCYHASYVLNDEECLCKINTWGHTNDFNKEKWYKEKWLHWNQNTTHLHPINKELWYKAIKFNGDLPEIISDLKNNIDVKEYTMKKWFFIK